jgi:uncharacterized protein YndB with AHSA1/START domain
MPDVSRTIAAPPARVWEALVDLDRWPDWGPSVRRAELDGGGRILSEGASGRVSTVGGVTLPFRVTEFVDGERWSWDVGSVAATSHAVVAAPGGSVVTFGVPWWAAPYAAVCHIALGRIERVVTDG